MFVASTLTDFKAHGRSLAVLINFFGVLMRPITILALFIIRVIFSFRFPNACSVRMSLVTGARDQLPQIGQLRRNDASVSPGWRLRTLPTSSCHPYPKYTCPHNTSFGSPAVSGRSPSLANPSTTAEADSPTALPRSATSCTPPGVACLFSFHAVGCSHPPVQRLPYRVLSS